MFEKIALVPTRKRRKFFVPRKVFRTGKRLKRKKPFPTRKEKKNVLRRKPQCITRGSKNWGGCADRKVFRTLVKVYRGKKKLQLAPQLFQPRKRCASC